MTHRQAVLAMVGVALLWSIAGVVTRQLEAARSFEVTFWRSAFNAVTLVLVLAALRGPAVLARSLVRGRRVLWISGACWAVMFTAFMVAITLTTVANVLVTMALAPLFTALAARLALGHRLARHTWGAIVVAGVGIGWMYAREVTGAGSQDGVGTAVAMAVPMASAVNWTTLQSQRSARGGAGARPDLLVSVLLGAALSAVVTLPLAMPFEATVHDLGLLALLGSVQLALPCLAVVAVARVLSAPELALLALLEVVFGVAWAWIGAGETPSASVLGGGALVLGAMVANESLALRRAASRSPPESASEPPARTSSEPA